MNKLPKTLLSVLKSENNIIIEGETADAHDDFIYIYDVYNKLIEATGRFCEAHQTDLLVSINALNRRIRRFDSGLYFFGVRELGVDHNSYVFLRLKEHANDDKYYASTYYRKLFAFEFHKETKYGEQVIHYKLRNASGIVFDNEDMDFPIEDIDKEIGNQDEKREV